MVSECKSNGRTEVASARTGWRRWWEVAVRGWLFPTDWRRRVRILLFLAVLLAPLKMGIVIGGGEGPHFPVGWPAWAFETWPSFLMAGLCGLALVYAMAYGAPRWGRPAAAVVGLWWALALASCIGFIRTTEWDYALRFSVHLAGAACLVTAVAWIRVYDEAVMRWVLVALALGTLLAAQSGWDQRFGALEATRRAAERSAAEEGRVLHAAIVGRMEQGRVFGPFVYPNSFAAHLLLTGPLTVLACWRLGRARTPQSKTRRAAAAGAAVLFLLGLFNAPGGLLGMLFGVLMAAGVLLWSHGGERAPPALRSWYGGVLAAVLVGGAFWWSGSRGAVVAAGVGAGVGVLSLSRLRRWRWPLLGLAVGVGLAALAVASRNRSLLSVSARLHYYTAALRLFARHPIVGVGLGEFFHGYLRLKPVGAEETRVVHNMVLCLLSQAGMAAGVLAALCLAVPGYLALLVPARRRRSDPALVFCVLAGLAGWGAHALVDFNVQIPGTVTLAALLPLYALPDRAPAEAGVTLIPAWRWVGLVAGLAVGVLSFWRIPGERSFQQLANELPRLSLRRALERTEETASLLPSSPYPWVLLGTTAWQRGRFDLAHRSYAEAARRTPHRASFRARMAESSLLQGQVTRAEAEILAALEGYPGEGRYLLILALVRLYGADDLASPRPAPRLARLHAALMCRTNTGRDEAGLEVLLLPPTGVQLPADPVRQAAADLNALGLRHPLWDEPVRFVLSPSWRAASP